MLREEFEKQVGMSVDDKTWADANNMYMYAGDSINQEQFCRAWKHWYIGGQSPLVYWLLSLAMAKDDFACKAISNISKVADLLLDVCSEAGLSESHFIKITSCVHQLIGKRETISRKCKMKVPFTDEEIGLMIENWI